MEIVVAFLSVIILGLIYLVYNSKNSSGSSSNELIQFSKEDFDKEKPIMKAYKEFIDSELEWRSNDDVDNLDDK